MEPTSPAGLLPGKLIFKKAVSGLFAGVRSLSGRKYPGNGFRALNYHSISDKFSDRDICAQMTTPRGLFEDQMRFLKERGYSVLSCSEAVNMMGGSAAMPPKSVCITLDDGFKDNLVNGLPALERYGLKATIFLTVDYIGRGGEYLNWDDIKTLSGSGLISFGSHSMSHRKLSLLGTADLEKELVTSKHILEDRLAAAVDLFAYPFGSYGSFDSKTEEFLRSCGYRAAFTTIAGFNTLNTDPFRLRRTRISWYDDKTEFAKELSGDYDWYRMWQMMAGPR